MVERAIDRRMQVWLTQLLDALTDLEEDEDADLAPDFAVSLTRSLEQARTGQGLDLTSFRSQLGS